MLDVHINAAGRFLCEPDWSWDTADAAWNDTDLWLVLAGRGTLETPDHRYTLGRGDCFLLQGGRRYVGSHDPDAPLTVIAVHFDVLSHQGQVALPAELCREHRTIEDPEFLAQCLERVLVARYAPHSGRTAGSAEFWLQAALREIVEIDQSDGPVSDTLSPITRVRQLYDYLRSHPTERHDLSTLASRCGLSPTHFSRLFREVAGMPPGRFLIAGRIEAAKSLLRDSDYSMKRVAGILGYRDQFFFSRQFRRETGQSPGAFRTKSNTEQSP